MSEGLRVGEPIEFLQFGKAKPYLVVLKAQPSTVTLAIAGKGYRKALLDDPHLLNGLNVIGGKVTYEAVAEALGLPYTPARDAL